MTTINLKDFYYWYLTDVLVEMPDEVAEELIASKRREAAHAERVRYNLSLIHIWEAVAVKGNIDCLLGHTDERNKAQER